VKAAWSSSGIDPKGLDRSLSVDPYPYSGSCDEGAKQSKLGAIVRPVDTEGLVFALKPGIDTCFVGARTRTNSHGLRGLREYERTKVPGTFRILLLGDSQTFGHGVEFEETFGQRLEDSLQSRLVGKTIEVINTGVNGYNLYQEAAYFTQVGIGYDPDIVLILFITNDLDLPFFLYDPDRPLDLERSYALELLRNGFKLVRNAFTGSVSRGRWHAVPLPSQVPPKYAHMAGIESYDTGLREIARVANAHGIPVLNFVDEPMALQVWGSERARARTTALERALGIIRPPFKLPRGYPLSKTDSHANPEGHRLIAERMLAPVISLLEVPTKSSAE